MAAKKLVHYREAAYIKVGDSALITPVDHPSQDVSNTCMARTSQVIRHDPASGAFETLNTIYKKVDA